jgi:hypothetical protein
MHLYVAADLGLTLKEIEAGPIDPRSLSSARNFTPLPTENRGWWRERRATRRGEVRLWVLAVLLRLGNRYEAALAFWHLKGPLSSIKGPGAFFTQPVRAEG